MTLDDEQLDDLLRQVDVPGGLKASLLTIPDRNVEVEALPTSKSWTALLGTVAALAASVVLYFSISPHFASTDIDLAGALVGSGGSGGSGGSTEIAMLLDEMKQNNASIDSVLQLQEIKRNVEPQTGPIFDSKETVATALSLSWQAAIDRGASLESVRSDLQYVIDQYPETAGAQRAQGLLQIN